MEQRDSVKTRQSSSANIAITAGGRILETEGLRHGTRRDGTQIPGTDGTYRPVFIAFTLSRLFSTTVSLSCRAVCLLEIVLGPSWMASYVRLTSA